MSDATKRWVIGYTVYLVGGAAACAIMIDTGHFATPVIIVFIFGYLVGRLSKMIERNE